MNNDTFTITPQTGSITIAQAAHVVNVMKYGYGPERDTRCTCCDNVEDTNFYAFGNILIYLCINCITSAEKLVNKMLSYDAKYAFNASDESITFSCHE